MCITGMDSHQQGSGLLHKRRCSEIATVCAKNWPAICSAVVEASGHSASCTDQATAPACTTGAHLTDNPGPNQQLLTASEQHA